MAIRILPDAEQLAVDFLRAHPDIAAGVSTELPAEPVWPRLTVRRVGGLPGIAGYLDAARLEISAWAATKAAAHDLARTAEAVILTLPGPHDGAVVTGVDQVGEGLRWNPDEESDVPRYVFVVEVWVHPAG